jgi:ATP-dependent DNA helicase RecQ
MWGHDFRPDYLFIAEARHELGDPPALAMTATAPPRVRDEIIDYISADAGSRDALAEPSVRPRVLTLDIFRDNLHLSALEFHNEDEKMGALLQFAAETPGSGIVYVNSRHKAETLAFALREAGVAAEAYHAGLADRGPVQDRFMSDKTRVVVATIAFGMGIDKADIRFIVHFHPSRSLDAYYQEVGRAGRDGKPSQGVLFFSTNDWSNMRRWARSDEYNSDFLVRVYNAVAGQLGVPVPEAPAGEPAPEEAGGEESAPQEMAVPRPEAPQLVQEPGSTEAVTGSVDARRLQQVLNADETEIRVAISLLERADLLTRGFDIPQELGVTLPDRIPELAKADRRFARFLKGLRLGPAQTAAYATGDIARFLKCSHEDAEQQLLDWQDLGWVQVKGNRRTMLVELPPRPADLRERLERLLQQTTALSQRRIDDVIGYATTESCRHGYISAHFGSPPRLRCTVCDVCTGIRPDLPVPERIERQAPDDAELVPMLLDCLISLPRPVGRSGLARILAGNLRAPVGPDKARHFGRLKGMGEEALVTYIDDLLADGRLRQYERQGYPVLAPTARGRMEAEAWLGEHPELGALGEPLAQPDETDGDTPAEADKYTALQKQIWRWRRQMADSQGQPAYVIMSNETMLRIAEARPRTLEELGSLPGMGERRKNAYGPVLLDLVLNNPPQTGDEALLAQQRDAPPAGEGGDADEKSGKAKSSRPPVVSAPAVTPQQERKIATRLEEMRLKRAIARRLKPFEVASSPLMREIARRGPMTLEELRAVPGFAASPFHEDAQTIVDFVISLRRPPV